MKHRISITLDEKTVLQLKEKLRTTDCFRNQSHLVEVAINNILKS